MEYWIKEGKSGKYIECVPGKWIIATERDAIDFVGICGENDTHRLLLHLENLSEAFFDLKTGLAGSVLQKFVNYQMKVAAVIPLEQIKQRRFKEMVGEANRGGHFRVFSDLSQAEEWLNND